MATGGDDWLDLPTVWPDLTSAPLNGGASVVAAFRARARHQEQWTAVIMKPGLGDRFFYAESGGWALARILVIFAGPAVLVLSIGITKLIEVWN